MTCLGVARVLEHQVRQIIADHMNAKYGVKITAENVELWPNVDRYGNKPYADVNMVGQEAFRRVG
jgi:hypothetical protein